MNIDIKAALPELEAYAESDRQDLFEIAKAIWNYAETAFTEVKSSKLLADKLASYGFAVEKPYAGMETAFRGEFVRGEGGPTFALAAEYDALPGLGHGCGHNLGGVATIAAALAAKKYMEKHDVAGRLVILGTPGEEGGGGKVLMLRNSDCLKGVDAVMMAHACGATKAESGSSGICRFDVIFHGKAAHAAGSPHKGLNALDAQVLLYNAVGLYRQQMDPLGVIHGVIHEGGEAANIIPDRTRSRYYIRSVDSSVIAKIKERFDKMVEGAALMTGTAFEIKEYSIPYQPRRPNRPLIGLFIDCAAALGMNPASEPMSSRGSSDFGDFSQAAPGAHPYFGISADPTASVPGHSEAMKACANSEFGREQMLRAGACLAACALAVFTDPAFRAEVRADFEKR